MAVCTICDQEMLALVACTQTMYEIGGRRVRRLRFPEGDGLTWPEHCGDCGTPMGGLHHPGCDLERCPNDACAAAPRAMSERAQAISCGCVTFGDPDEAC
jgi:hypothetical protein